MTDRHDVESRIREFFDINYRQMLAEGGAHVLTPHALTQAREQVEHYWMKLRDIAVNVTETEVRLQLPNRTTPKGRKFVIEGVVDLVREADRIKMYDIKTHYAGEVERHLDAYVAQLNVYAYIWRELRGHEIHDMGIIAVQLPDQLRAAIRRGDQPAIERELRLWNPLVPLPFSSDAIDETFKKIALTVDKIEDGLFSPPPTARLTEAVGQDENASRKAVTFATLHCRNCDGRFSCDSYRKYVVQGGRIGRQSFLQQYITQIEPGDDAEEWIDDNLEIDQEIALSD